MLARRDARDSQRVPHQYVGIDLAQVTAALKKRPPDGGLFRQWANTRSARSWRLVRPLVRARILTFRPVIFVLFACTTGIRPDIAVIIVADARLTARVAVGIWVFHGSTPCWLSDIPNISPDGTSLSRRNPQRGRKVSDGGHLRRTGINAPVPARAGTGYCEAAPPKSARPQAPPEKSR